MQTGHTTLLLPYLELHDPFISALNQASYMGGEATKFSHNAFPSICLVGWLWVTRTALCTQYCNKHCTSWQAYLWDVGMGLFVLVSSHGEGESDLLWITLTAHAHALQSQLGADRTMLASKVMTNHPPRSPRPSSWPGRLYGGTDHLGLF